jgi:DNA repair protein RadD
MTDTLRGYQVDVIAEIERAIAGGERRILLVAPTGSGKTVIGGEFIGRFSQSYRSVLVLAHRLEIVTQTSAKLHARDIRHGIIKAGFSPRPMERVQVASVQTLWVRAVRSDAMQLPPADLLIVDECHHATAMTWRKLIAAYPDAVLIGLTATPCRGDGRGLGGIFTTMIECPQVAELIAQGYLVKTRVYAPVDPDLRGVKTQAGDYVESQLADRMDVPKLIGDIVTHWHKFGECRKTVAFAVNVAHSRHLYEEFVRSGVRCEHLDGETPKDERDAILAARQRGNRGRHQLHGAHRGLGHARGWLRHSGAPDQKDGPLSPNDRPRAAAGRWQGRRHHPRPLRRGVSARPRRGSGGVDARPRKARGKQRASSACEP